MCRGLRSQLVDRGTSDAFDIGGEALIKWGIASNPLDIRRREVVLRGEKRHQFGDRAPSHCYPDRLTCFHSRKTALTLLRSSR